MPFNNSSILSAPLMRRHDVSACSISLKARPRKVGRETQMRVRVVRWRTVAKADSIALVVRMCCQCVDADVPHASHGLMTVTPAAV